MAAAEAALGAEAERDATRGDEGAAETTRLTEGSMATTRGPSMRRGGAGRDGEGGLWESAVEKLTDGWLRSTSRSGWGGGGVVLRQRLEGGLPMPTGAWSTLERLSLGAALIA